jgi:uncharacterized protein
VAPAQWLPFVHDFDAGRPAPPGVSMDRLLALVRRRHADLAAAIAARRWFDPWVFEVEPEEGSGPLRPTDVVLPWIAGWATALERFPALLAQATAQAHEPLATLYGCFEPEDLEDMGELAPLIEQIGPPETLDEAVEDLVRCTLLLADAMQPRRSGSPR